MNCTGCGRMATTLLNTGDGRSICNACQAGDRDPSEWLVEKAFETLEMVRKRDVETGRAKYPGGYQGISISRDGKIVVGDEVPSVAVHIGLLEKDGKTHANIYRWTDGGGTAVTPIIFDYDFPANDPKMTSVIKKVLPDVVRNTVRELWEMQDDGTIICTGCRTKIEGDPAGRHFAGCYCSKCWEEYKTSNSRRCGSCGSHKYECCC